MSIIQITAPSPSITCIHYQGLLMQKKQMKSVMCGSVAIEA